MEKLSIIIPVYNEENTIKKILQRVKNAKSANMPKEVIVIDDFSGDSTRSILKRINDRQIQIFYHEKNMGKGAAVRTGLKNASGDIILIQDADLEYSPEDYPKLLKPIIDKKADVVYGSRIGAIRKNIRNMYKLHYIGNLFLTLMTRLLYRTKLSDMETGYKVFRKEAIRGIKIKSNRFDFEPEITAKILKMGVKIHEVPVSFDGRKFGEGKKITWIDGIKAAYCLLKYRFFD